MLYLTYISDLPITEHTTTSIFTDNISYLGNSWFTKRRQRRIYQVSSANLQDHLSSQELLKKIGKSELMKPNHMLP